MNLIQCENVCVNYGTFEACKDVSFSLNKGDYLCVVGANGSGKTTIVKAILGLQQIKSGKIIFEYYKIQLSLWNFKQLGYHLT